MVFRTPQLEGPEKNMTFCLPTPLLHFGSGAALRLQHLHGVPSWSPMRQRHACAKCRGTLTWKGREIKKVGNLCLF